MIWFGWFRKPNGQNKDAGEVVDLVNAAGAPCLPSAEAVPAAAPVPPSTAAVTPDEVRRMLFDAVAAGDDGRLEALCREHKEFILTHVAGWLEIPPSFRASPEAYEWYGNGLRAVARFCADKLGHQEVVHQLSATHEVPQRVLTVDLTACEIQSHRDSVSQEEQ